MIKLSEYRHNESKAACGQTPFKIFFWINETNIYTTIGRSRYSQLHRLERLNTSASRYISWKKIDIFARQW